MIWKRGSPVAVDTRVQCIDPYVDHYRSEKIHHVYADKFRTNQKSNKRPGWEKDAESFSRVVAKHHIRNELRRSLDVKRMSRVTSTTWRIDFPNNIAVYVSLEKVPDFVVAARWYPEPAGPSRYYTYSCTSGGQPVFTERKRP